MVTVVVLQILSTFLLTGLSWYVQLVHYPIFHYISESQFSQFHKAHVVRTQMIIFTLLPIELVTSSLTALYGFPGLPQSQWILGWILLILICLSTALVQMPLHSKLATSKSSQLIEKLILSHWLRTALWSVRFSMLAGFLFQALISKSTSS